MKTIGFLSLSLLLVFACKNTNNKEAEHLNTNRSYPETMLKIFNAHGGLANWNAMKSMSYEIVKGVGNEKQIIDLQDRRERIEANNFSMGYDGTNFWLDADSTYEGNPVFYKNLMFYFYAMPFVLADEGIIYSETKPLNFEGKDYPGVNISYGDNIGVSPEDEYIVYCDPETYEMAWLGYTVTYFTKEKSEKIKIIRYDDWMEIRGLKLPKSLAWYNVENGELAGLRNRVQFENVVVDETRFADSTFQRTVDAIIVDQ